MIRPPCCFNIGRIAACDSRKVAVRLVASTASQSSRFMRRSSWSRVMPALLTRMSRRPNLSTMAAGSRSSATPSVTSRLTASLRPESRLLFLETIANPTVAVSDQPALLEAGRAAGLACVVDNTFATPVLCRPIEHGADIVVHSATKYLGGHDDVTLGLVVSASREMHRALWKSSVDLGVAADPFAAWLTVRGLKTLALRMARHCANAAFLAERLVAHPAVAAVHWPGLASHPDHAVARRLLSGYGGMVAFDVAGGREAGLRFITALRLAAMAPSLGGVETLVLHPASTSHRQLDAAGLSAAGIGEGSIRVSVGLEHPEDLWADFQQALAALPA